MTEVGVRELKAQASELIRRIRERGEVIDITYHGEVVARLVPVAPPTLPPDEIAALLTDLDQLAAEIGANWPDDVSAVDAIRQARRSL